MMETGTSLDVNDAAVRMYGYTEQEFRHMMIKDIRPSWDIGISNIPVHFPVAIFLY
jgi:hypothetical protein